MAPCMRARRDVQLAVDKVTPYYVERKLGGVDTAGQLFIDSSSPGRDENTHLDRAVINACKNKQTKSTTTSRENVHRRNTSTNNDIWP